MFGRLYFNRGVEYWSRCGGSVAGHQGPLPRACAQGDQRGVLTLAGIRSCCYFCSPKRILHLSVISWLTTVTRPLSVHGMVSCAGRMDNSPACFAVPRRCTWPLGPLPG